MVLAIVLKAVGIAAVVWLSVYSFACHMPCVEAGMTGQLVDEGEGRIPLFSFSFLADEHWGGTAVPVPGIRELLLCVHYDTIEDGSGHVLSLRLHAPDVRVRILQKGTMITLHQGQDWLLENGDQIVISQGEIVRRYRYERKTIYPKGKEEGQWLH